MRDTGCEIRVLTADYTDNAMGIVNQKSRKESDIRAIRVIRALIDSQVSDPGKDETKRGNQNRESAVDNHVLPAGPARSFRIRHSGECHHGVKRQVDAGEQTFKKMFDLLPGPEEI